MTFMIPLEISGTYWHKLLLCKGQCCDLNRDIVPDAHAHIIALGLRWLESVWDSQKRQTTMTRTIGWMMTALLLTSCATYFGGNDRRGVSSSLVDYLYPEGQVPPKHEETTPHLQLPLTIGLAFVPSQQTYAPTVSEATKVRLLDEVKRRFVGLHYIKDITIIPETYMRSAKGFEGVGQMARLYGLDVVALVSYDQVVVTSETKKSLLYWTIVGAYLVKGNENKSTTFVDTAVFDVSSRKMLFRAPGVSELKKSSTLVDVDHSVRETREQGFGLAMVDMSNNLAAELERFEDRIKQDQSVQVSHRQGYGGGGSMQWPMLLLLAGLVSLRLIKR